ncbi:hypothetical protein [Leifsonia sp. 2MCAF36]|uniref:hypothetical protein n=1 Tax=Leifsonia sp. 2MCAF36 TaxID=3232988 RepID=UPI003F987B24
MLATVGATLALLVGGAAVAAPASAVGTKNGKCTYYDSFVGTSTATGNSYTSGQKSLCGDVKIRVGYNPSGGTAVYTPWKRATGSVMQGPVGYVVFGGEHTITNPGDISVGDPLIRT